MPPRSIDHASGYSVILSAGLSDLLLELSAKTLVFDLVIMKGIIKLLFGQSREDDLHVSSSNMSSIRIPFSLPSLML